LLSDVDKALYARQILLSELGAGGQERLTTAAIAFANDADPRARAVASEYLSRAGVGSRPDDAPAVEVPVASTATVQRTAADPALEDCAAWLLGAYAAVEAIKARAGAGTAADFPSDYTLGAEVR